MEDRYLGDGVYARFDGYQIRLRADRDGRSHEIALNGETFNALIRYQRDLAAQAKSAAGDAP